MHSKIKRDKASTREYNHLHEELLKLTEQEDTYWRQRAKQHWLRDED